MRRRVKLVHLVVEGPAEYDALPILVRTAGGGDVRRRTFHGQGVNADLREMAIARILPQVRAAMASRARKVVVVLDREWRQECPPEIAQLVHAAIREELARRFGYRGSPPLSVVCADRTLENWLLADPEGVSGWATLRKPPVSSSQSRVDELSACDLINNACKKNRCYHKRRDARRLAERVRAGDSEVQERSRSLKKFLKEACLGPRSASEGRSSGRR